MSRKLLMGLSLAMAAAGMYFYRPSLTAAVRRATSTTLLAAPAAATTASTMSVSPSVKIINLPMALSTKGTLTASEASDIKTFLNNLNKSYDNYNQAIFAVVNRLKSDSFYSAFASLSPALPTVGITESDIIAAGEKVFKADPRFAAYYANDKNANFYKSQGQRSRPDSGNVAALKRIFSDVSNSQAEAVNKTSPDDIKSAILFPHISDFPTPSVPDKKTTTKVFSAPR